MSKAKVPVVVRVVVRVAARAVARVASSSGRGGLSGIMLSNGEEREFLIECVKLCTTIYNYV